jgi:hypothetical protein
MIRFALWLGLCLFVTSVSHESAHAQESRRAGAKGGSKASAPKRAPKAKRAKAKEPEKTPVRSASTDKSANQTTTPAAPEPEARPGAAAHSPSEDAAALAADADERVRKEGAEEIKTVEFGGLDIEGQLKTPQMLYFLNRLRAEFSRPELPHRSFMPELQRGTQENGF